MQTYFKNKPTRNYQEKTWEFLIFKIFIYLALCVCVDTHTCCGMAHVRARGQLTGSNWLFLPPYRSDHHNWQQAPCLG